MNFDIEQDWSIKDLLYGKTIFLLDTAGNPERQDSAILSAGVANRSAGFCLRRAFKTFLVNLQRNFVSTDLFHGFGSNAKLFRFKNGLSFFSVLPVN